MAPNQCNGIVEWSLYGVYKKTELILACNSILLPYLNHKDSSIVNTKCPT